MVGALVIWLAWSAACLLAAAGFAGLLVRHMLRERARLRALRAALQAEAARSGAELLAASERAMDERRRRESFSDWPFPPDER